MTIFFSFWRFILFLSIDRVCVPSDVLLGFMHLKKKAATSSGLIQGNTFISQLVYRCWGGLWNLCGVCHFSGLAYEICQLERAAKFSFRRTWCLPLVSVCSTAGSLVLQQQVTPRSFFLIGPRASKYISFPISTPSQAKHKPVSCAAIQTAGTPDTHSSSLPRMKPPGGTWAWLQSHTSLCRFSGAKPCQFHQHSESGESNQSLGHPSESWNFRWTFHSPLSPTPMMGNWARG